MSHATRKSYDKTTVISNKTSAGKISGSSRIKRRKCGITCLNWRKNLIKAADIEDEETLAETE